MCATPSARLWVVATPLGNLGDLSPRARDVLASADMVLAEDTRRAGLLFQRLGLPAKGFLSLYEHNEEARVEQVLAALAEGRNAALVSDAGTPLLSDPGYRLVRACRAAGLPVSPVPGPSAPIAALSACGLPPLPFVFLGFLPRKDGDIRRLLETYAALPATLVFFERKTRLSSTLALAAEVLGPREFCVARELTKEFEEFIQGRLDALDALPEEFLGEITVVVGPPEASAKTTEEALLELLREESARGGKPREVARRAASRAPGWSAKETYDKLRGLRED
ncbi:16S rRNA (cytidine(1402)-2'-O)-methyltransferase [Desulfovibrio aminophilus]|uniref:16S rRNA (cytidine(1402)-2'-O)-methyltransferase n=1 Tax=Desulfovibrio aminophilus TaxID=81425 RepID=UPI003396C7A0